MIDGVRAEIRFFLEKCFQASFGYLASVLVIAGTSRLAYVKAVAGSAGMSRAAFVGGLVLFFNFVYLSVLTSCLFAILKRGLFLLRTGSEADRSWEVFTRHSGRGETMRTLPWNIDNLYMAPFILLVLIFSTVAFAAGWDHGNGRDRALVLVLVLMHVIPAVMLWYLWKLDRQCSEAATTAA